MKQWLFSPLVYPIAFHISLSCAKHPNLQEVAQTPHAFHQDVR